MKLFLAVYVPFISGIFALPSTASNVQTADFDGDEFVPFPEPILNQIPSPYRGLNYTGLIFQGTGIVPGVVPRSEPNYAGTGPFTRATGQRTTFSPDGKSSRSFDLLEIYYGCITATFLEDVQVSIGCSFIVTGYKNGGTTKVGTVRVGFSPSSLDKATMQLQKFGSAFLKLDKVEIELVLTNPIDVNTVILLDNIKYQLYP